MKFIFFAKRFLIVLVGAFIVLMAVALVRGRSWQQALGDSALWASIAATIFIVTRIYRSSRGEACALCGDPGQGQCDVKTDKGS